MPIVERSHRVLYMDKSSASRQALNLLNALGITFAAVEIQDPKKDARQISRLPAFTYVSRSGFQISRLGFDEIEAAAEALKSDYTVEVEERKREERGELSEWDPEQIEQMRRTMGILE